MVDGRPVTAASLLDSTPAISWSKGVTKAAMPSSSSFLVTSPMSMPASARAASVSDGSSSAVVPATSAFSAAASRVAMGIVFTVWGATRPSTYLVSG